ncbi:MAG: putative rho guanine nucleotide exchange factor 17 [Streblomastix strix]|uniref:Putative rho guanine nucleotide exchange factor 17 n=1 Tax=Streblomastix strix TaxID=222440 RepID=A0A5J4X5N4_9EUKA|nr:MAG: putative rho guanine nucleotide exchange factor 17 [Streblomastix strix]
MRESVMKELLETERTYVKSLGQLQQFYFTPTTQYFKDKNQGEIEPELKELMKQSKNLLMINQKFLADLENRLGAEITPETRISDILMQFAPIFKMFVPYIDAQLAGTGSFLRLDKKNKNFHKEIIQLQKNAGQEFSFQSLVITPVQRVPRYIMLVKETLKHTDKEHPDYEGLEKSLTLLQETANRMNDHLKNRIKMQRMIDLSNGIEGIKDLVRPQRTLLKEGALIEIERNAKEQRYILLFSDILLICKLKQPSNSPLQLPTQMKLVYQIDLHKPIRCIDCSVVNEEQQKEGGQQVNSQDGQVAQRYKIDESKIDKQKSNDQSSSKPLFMILTSSKTYLIEGSFVKETREWIKAIKNARGNIQEQEEDLKKRRTVTKKLINGETTTELMEDKFNKSFSEENLIQQGQQQSYDEYDEQDDGLNQSEEDRKADEALEIIPPKDPILWERHLSHMGIDWLNVKSFKTEDQKQEKEKIKELRPLDSNKSENENEETIQEDKTILEQEHKLRQIIQSSFSEVKQESTILSLSEISAE